MKINHPFYAKSLVAISALFLAFGFISNNPAKDGEWSVLFDGSNLDAWRGWKMDHVPTQWKIEDGTLVLDGKGGVDLITKKEYGDFILELDWKISKGGNSGIIYHVVEADSLERTYWSGQGNADFG